ncbi:MAG TPA: AAA family ATPase, partial [Bacteroidetes bacterium]|nr:AAA family ATPase [Bacteroidota bacterium]
MTPRQIVRALDEYIIGQDAAKKAVAIALRNRWRRRRIEGEIREEIIPNNILMIGPTGVGKTEIARRLARLAGAPFIKVEASKFTEVGYVGRDVEGMVRDLVEAAVAQVKGERTAEVEEQAAGRVEERLLDLLLPPIRRPKPPGDTLEDVLFASLGGKSLPEGAAAEPAEVDEGLQARHARTREKLRAKLRAGELEEAEIEVTLPDRGGSVMQLFGPVGIEEMGINIQELFGGMLPEKKKRRRVTVGEARPLLLG